MFESFKKIFLKKTEDEEVSAISLEELPAWLDAQEVQCITRRNAETTKSRQRLLIYEQHLRELLSEFGQESVSDQPHHHKVEQVNRHALPEFCKKIEAELTGKFSDDDEIFYREFAGLINGCFKAYRGPGRYLHHLYPEEIKVFRETLDQMGHELNRMTDIIRISRDHLASITMIRALLKEWDVLRHEMKELDEEEKKSESRLFSLQKELDDARDDLARLLSSDVYCSFVELETEIEHICEQNEKTGETWESHIRTAMPVWKRAVKALQEQAKSEDEKNMEELIQCASSSRRDNDEVTRLVTSTAKALFDLLDSGIVHTKNSFEKQLFTSADEYTNKFREISVRLHNLSDELNRKRQEHEASPILKQREQSSRIIDEVEKQINAIKQEQIENNDKCSLLRRKKAEIIEKLKENFAEFTERKMKLLVPDGEL